MKKIILSLICFLLVKSLSAQETIILNYEDRFSIPTEKAIIKTCLPKTNRLSSSSGGTIETLCANNFSEEMQQCIKVAAQLWEEKLFFPNTIVLQFEKERLGKDAPGFKVEVAYTPINSVDFYPQSLAVNLGLVSRGGGVSDAIITINEDINWDMGFSDESKNKNNFTTAMLRSIAISLGFGSSVHKNPLKGIVFGLRGHFSPFDNMVVNSQNKFLNQVPNTGRENAELVSYVTGNNVYCKYPDNSSYKLYAPSTFKDGFTLNYFDSRGDLMSYNVQEGDKILQIDDRTLDIIKQIGWKPQTDNLKIIGTGIDNTGIASAYQSYQFRAESSSSITAYSWKYELQKTNGDFATIATSKSSVFTINKVDDESKYAKNINGDIQGRISLEATVGGKVMKKIFYIYLEVKPFFISVKVDKATAQPGNKYFYDLDITILYSGADYLYVALEMENSMTVRTQYVYEPYVAHLHLTGIEKEGMAWVDIELRNKYGTVKHTVEMPVQTNLFRPGLEVDWVTKPVDFDGKVEYYYIYDKQGALVMQTADYQQIYNLPKDMYIIKAKGENESVQVKKIMLK